MTAVRGVRCEERLDGISTEGCIIPLGLVKRLMQCFLQENHTKFQINRMRARPREFAYFGITPDIQRDKNLSRYRTYCLVLMIARRKKATSVKELLIPEFYEIVNVFPFFSKSKMSERSNDA